MGDYYEGKFDDKPLTLLSIKEHRIKREMSQLSLSQATHLRVPQNVISELESGRRLLTGYTIPHLCNVFKVGKEDLILGNNLALAGVKLEDRFKAVKSVANNEDLFIAGKGIARAQKLDKKLDFGGKYERDSFGRVLSKSESLARKRIKETGEDSDFGGKYERDSFGKVISKRESDYNARKRAEKRTEKDDFGDRDDLGFRLSEKQIAEKTRIADKKIDDLDDIGDKKIADVMKGTEDAKYLAKLNALLKKGKDDKGSVGLKNIVAMKMDFDKDFLASLEGMTEDQQFLAKLIKLIETGRASKKMREEYEKMGRLE